jgi:hypothetical protein
MVASGWAWGGGPGCRDEDNKRGMGWVRSILGAGELRRVLAVEFLTQIYKILQSHLRRGSRGWVTIGLMGGMGVV